MSEVIDEIADVTQPRMTRQRDGRTEFSPFRSDSELVAAAEEALSVAAVLRVRVVEGGF